MNSQNFDKKLFEFVIVKSETLQHRKPEREDFEEYFTDGDEAAVTFQNLGKDAYLIAPNPWQNNESDAYGHIAAFMKKSSNDQVKIYENNLDGNNSVSIRFL